MNVWSKFHTLIRASAQEPIGALVDANGIRIFEQELRDAEQAMGRSKRQLACLVAEKKFLERDNDTLREAIGRRESQASVAIEQGHHDLALEVATECAHRSSGDHPFRCCTDPHQAVGASTGEATGNGSLNITIGDGLDTCTGGADLSDQILVTGTVHHDDGQLVRGEA